MNTSDPLKNIRIPQIQQSKLPLAITGETRTKEFCQDIISEYRVIKSQLKSDQTINLVCMIGGMEYDVYSIGWRGGIVHVDTRTKDAVILVRCPIEQAAFAMIISRKTSNEPPREIGFKAIEEEHKKAAK